MPEIVQLPARAPVRATPLRTPLSRRVEQSLAAQDRLFSDPLVSLRTAQLALGNPCYSTLQRWIKLGILPVVRFSKKGHYKVRQSTLDALLTKGVPRG